MKQALLKLALVVSFLALGAYTVPGLIPDDGDGDGVPDSVDVCPNEDPSPFDRDGDGCIDDFIGGRHIEYWGVDDASISYVINEQGVPSITNGSDLTAVQSAFTSWSSLPNTELTVVYGGTTTQTNSNGLDGVNLVTFVDNAYPFSNLVLAVGLSTSFEADTLIDGRVYRQGEIFDADMVFNPNKTYKVGGQGPGTDIQSVATHEAGHLFGISHSIVQSATMFYVLPGGLAARTLEQDDRLVYRKAYTNPTALASLNRIEGVVTDGQTGNPVPGAAVFVKASVNDTAAVDYTLPDGSFSFPGLPDGSYSVWIHPIDGTSEVGFIQPANINALIASIAVENFVPEGYSNPETNTDDPFAASQISLNAGHRVETIEFITNIDAIAPVVTASNPANNTSDVAIDAAYIITFSEEIDINTIQANFAFRDVDTNARQSGNIGIIEDGKKIIFTPNPPLAFEKDYRLTLSTGLQDEFGNGLAAPFTLDITTELEPPVGISSISPNRGVAGTSVVITGNGFEVFPFPTVKFGNEVATISRVSPTTIVAEVPVNAVTGQVTVTNPDNEVSNALTFTVLSA
ncbi:MAG TPA: Ig-like domain-containing protein, partial [Candidatus Krumholzibacteria bacterium]|nr:Ig-like domain-containing protein [Candidatus Krumholzibacteria bacterium]